MIDKIDKISVGGGTTTVYRCALNHPADFDETLFQWLPQISRRLQNLERLFAEIQPLAAPLRQRGEIVWVEGAQAEGTAAGSVDTIQMKAKSKIQFKAQGSQLFINEKILLQTNELEKFIVQRWLQEKSGEALRSHPQLQASLQNILLASLGESSDDLAVNAYAHLPMTQQWVFLRSLPEFLTHLDRRADAFIPGAVDFKPWTGFIAQFRQELHSHGYFTSDAVMAWP